jgi:hypothetical protein
MKPYSFMFFATIVSSTLCGLGQSTPQNSTVNTNCCMTVPCKTSCTSVPATTISGGITNPAFAYFVEAGDGDQAQTCGNSHNPLDNNAMCYPGFVGVNCGTFHDFPDMQNCTAGTNEKGNGAPNNVLPCGTGPNGEPSDNCVSP